MASNLYQSPGELGAAPNPRAADALGDTWHTRLRELVDFKREHGHANVPQQYPPNPSLGIWVNKQRRSRSSLSEEKLDSLYAAGFDWGKKKVSGKNSLCTRRREETVSVMGAATFPPCDFC